MTKDDQDWLETLAEKLPEDIDPLISAQALAVRKALADRRHAIETDASRVGTIGLNEVRVRLQREGLMDSPKKISPTTDWRERVMEFIGMGPTANGMKAVPAWGIAATLVLAILVGYEQQEASTGFDPEVVRGSNVTTLVVENPEEQSNKILEEIKLLNPDGIEVKRFNDGSVHLKITESQAVIDYLSTLRIEPIAVGGFINIYITPKKN
jgi:hypothetical protein